MVARSWLVITMEERQRNFLREANPQTSHKILTLNEITGFGGDIEDPHGSSLEYYQKTYALIEERLNILIKMIKNDEIKLFKDKQ
jgi:protein-tyrosine-phosphatase